MRLFSMTMIALWLSCTGVLAADKPQPVKAELLADVTAVQPGETFNVGVRLTMEEGWHVYWLNPGDSGLPTKVEWKVPAGFKVNALDYPAPVRFDQPGNVVGYGYHHSLMLVAKVTAPKDLQPGANIEIAASANWLVCKDICLPGKAAVSLVLTAGGTSSPINRELFTNWLEQIPVAAAEKAEVQAANINIGRIVTLKWREPASNLQVFTDPGDAYSIRIIKIDTTGQTSTIRYAAEQLDKSAGPVEMTVVVAYDDVAGRHRSVKLIEPLGVKPK